MMYETTTTATTYATTMTATTWLSGGSSVESVRDPYFCTMPKPTLTIKKARRLLQQSSRLRNDGDRRNRGQGTHHGNPVDIATAHTRGAPPGVHAASPLRRGMHQELNPMAVHQQTFSRQRAGHCKPLRWLQRRAAEVEPHVLEVEVSSKGEVAFRGRYASSCVSCTSRASEYTIA